MVLDRIGPSGLTGDTAESRGRGRIVHLPYRELCTCEGDWFVKVSEHDGFPRWDGPTGEAFERAAWQFEGPLSGATEEPDADPVACHGQSTPPHYERSAIVGSVVERTLSLRHMVVLGSETVVPNAPMEPHNLSQLIRRGPNKRPKYPRG